MNQRNVRDRNDELYLLCSSSHVHLVVDLSEW